jgi:hypothetical protein
MAADLGPAARDRLALGRGHLAAAPPPAPAPGDADGTARFWDAGSGKQLGPTLRHTDAVLCVAFDPGGRRVATGTKDGVVQLWDVPPPPAEGGAEDVRRWVEKETGMRLDENGAVHTLPDESPGESAP